MAANPFDQFDPKPAPVPTANPFDQFDAPKAPRPTGPNPYNVGNLREVGSSQFRSFASPEEGVAANVQNLLAYNKRGINTVSKIISTWAPPSDNNPTAAYIANVSRALGVDPNAPLNMQDPAVMSKLITAIGVQEKGQRAFGSTFTPESISAGVNMGLGQSARKAEPQKATPNPFDQFDVPAAAQPATDSQKPANTIPQPVADSQKPANTIQAKMTPEKWSAIGGRGQPIKKPESVMAGYVAGQGKQEPLPSAERYVVDPKFIQAVETELNAVPKESRDKVLARLVQRNDAYGRAARDIQGRYQAMDKLTPEAQQVFDPRLEAQARKLEVKGGMDPQSAKAWAAQSLRRGVTPQVLPSAVRDVAAEQAALAGQQVKQKMEGAGFGARVGAEIGTRARQTGLGLAQIYADVAGDNELQKNLSYYRKLETAKGEAIPKGDSIAERSAQQAIASLGGQAPMMVLGAMTGTALPVLAQAGIEVFSQNYGQGRSAGLKPNEAGSRAGLMAVSEILFERYGLGDQLKAIRGVIDRVPTKDLSGYLTAAFLKEIPSEQATTLSQFLVDKLPGLGLNQNAGLKDYMEQAAETLRQTVIQSGASNAAIYGASKSERAFSEKVLPAVSSKMAVARAIGKDAERVEPTMAGLRAQSAVDGTQTVRAGRTEPTISADFVAPERPGRVEPTIGAGPLPPTPGERVEPTMGGAPATPAAPTTVPVVPGMPTGDEIEELPVTPVTRTAPAAEAPPVTPVTGAAATGELPFTPAGKGPSFKGSVAPTTAAARLPDTPTVAPVKPVKPFEPAAPQHQDADLPSVDVPIKMLRLSEDVPQFKYGADKRGVVKPLGGKFSREGLAPIAVWQRLDGSLEVISGRHRFDLAKRSGEETIPAQVYYESQGFTAKDAAIKDAELNVRDDQGQVKDYVNYFKESGMDRETAESKGFLARDKGKRGFTIGNQGSDELIESLRADQITDNDAFYIALNAPNDAKLQGVGMKAVLDGKSINMATNLMQAVRVMSSGGLRGTTRDIFGDDTAALEEAAAMADYAAKKQREVQNRLSAISGVAKRPELAKAEGINVNDLDAVKRREAELRQLKAKWDNWHSNSEAIAEIREAIGATPFELTSESEAERQAREDKEAAEKEEKERKVIADREVDLFGLTAPPSEEQAAPTGDLFTGENAPSPGYQAAYEPLRRATERLGKAESAYRNKEISKEELAAAQEEYNKESVKFSETIRKLNEPTEPTETKEERVKKLREARAEKPAEDVSEPEIKTGEDARTAEYQAALGIYRKAGERLVQAMADYRDNKISKEEFLAEEKAYDKAAAEFYNNPISKLGLPSEPFAKLEKPAKKPRATKAEKPAAKPKEVEPANIRQARKEMEAAAKTPGKVLTPAELSRRRDLIAYDQKKQAEALEAAGDKVVNGKPVDPDLPAKNRLVLMPCCDTKGDAKAPAMELYKGVFFQTLKSNQKSGAEPNIVILSAKHGFIEPTKEIEPYDQVMTPEKAEEFLLTLQRDMDSIDWPDGIKDVLIVGGKQYQRVMRAAVARLQEDGVISKDASINVTSGGIGSQRSQFGKYLQAIPAEQPKAAEPEAKEETEFEKELEAAYKKNAAGHARDTGGEIVWRKGDNALIRAYDDKTGDPVYVATFGRQRSIKDIEKYTGTGVSPSIKQEMIEAKKKAEQDAAEKHKANPFIKFVDGVAVSESVSPEIEGIVREWKKLLKLDVPIYIATIEDARLHKNDYTGPHRRVGSGTLNRNDLGSTRLMPDGSHYILFTKSTSPTFMLEILAHELGHVHQKTVYERASEADKKALKDAHQKWLDTHKTKTAQEVINSMRGRAIGQRRVKAAPTQKGEELPPYWRKFEEWYADQTARWAVSNKVPVTAVEKFFKRLGNQLRRFYQQLKARKYLPDETFAQYMDRVTAQPPVLTPDEDDTEYFMSTDTGAPSIQPTAKFQEDIPNEGWLDGKIKYAMQKPRNQFGVPHMGSITGYFSGPVYVPTRWFTDVKGERGEQQNVREKDLAAIRKIISETGRFPIEESGEYVPYIEVGFDGVPWISEGNHRIMAALAEGVEYIPVEIRYFDGGQRRAGKWRPDNLVDIQSSENVAAAVEARDVSEQDRASSMSMNTQDEQDLMQRYSRPHTPMLDNSPVLTLLTNAYTNGKDFVTDAVTSPIQTAAAAERNVTDALLNARNLTSWYGAGLESRDFARYQGQLRTSADIVTSSVALDNAIRSGNIGVEVIFSGGLEYNAALGNFVAVKRDLGMRGVYEAEAAIKKRLGNQLGTDIVQGYLEAKRSISIMDELRERTDALERAEQNLEAMEAMMAPPEDIAEAKKAVDDLKVDLEAINRAASSVNMSEEEMYEFAALDEKHPELRTLMDNWTAVNQNLLRVWRQVGLISQGRYETLSAIKDYVPWYRIMNDDEDIHSAGQAVQSTTRSLVNIGREKLFKSGRPRNVVDIIATAGQQDFKIQPTSVVKVKVNGKRISPDLVTATPQGDVRINMALEAGDLVTFETNREIQNIIDNMTRNVMRMTMNGIRQFASNRIVLEYAVRNAEGKIRVYPSVNPEEGKFNWMVNGKKVVVQIQDPVVVASIYGMENINLRMWAPMAAVANFTRRGVTLSGVFQVKQVFKDAPTAALVTGVRNPIALIGGVWKGFLTSLIQPGMKKAGVNVDPVIDILKAAGIGGFHSPARTPEAEIKRRLGIMNRNVYSAVIKTLDHIGDSSDMAQRVGVYKRVMAETGDQTQALYQAANVINFMHHGSAGFAQAAVKTVPFIGAWMNSTDVLLNSLQGGGLKGMSRKKAIARLAVAATTLSTLTILYCMLAGGDPEYDELDDQTKLRNIMIPGTKIVMPINTSAALIFKAIPELIYNKITRDGTKNENDARRLRRALAEFARDALLGPEPIPAGVKTLLEVGINHSFFTGRQITPQSVEGVEAAQQYVASTSELGKKLSAMTAIPGTSKRALNPMEADHIVRGLFGTAGAMAQWVSNSIEASTRPAPSPREMPITGSFKREEVPRGNEDLFYDFKEIVMEKHETLKKLIEREDYKAADKYIEKHGDIDGMYEYISETEEELKEINSEIRRLGESKDKTTTPQARRKEIVEMQRLRNELLAPIKELRVETFKNVRRQEALTE